MGKSRDCWQGRESQSDMPAQGCASQYFDSRACELFEDGGLEVERVHIRTFLVALDDVLRGVGEAQRHRVAWESLDVVNPPCPSFLDVWIKVWHTLIQMPEVAPRKYALDDLCLKSQLIIARKPL